MNTSTRKKEAGVPLSGSSFPVQTKPGINLWALDAVLPSEKDSETVPTSWIGALVDVESFAV